MTAPADSPELTTKQLATVRTYATPAALRYHDAHVPAEERVDLATSFSVHGNLKLVAADVLEVAASHRARTPGSSGGDGGTLPVGEMDLDLSSLKKVKFDGELEVEFRTPGATAEATLAEEWWAIAKRLRAEVDRAAPLVRPRAGIRLGSSGPPAFRRSDVVPEEWPAGERP